jgi:putative nucleic acid modification protein with dual OB domain
VAACQGGSLVVHFTNRKNAPFPFPHERGRHHSSYYWVKVGEFPREKLTSISEAGPLWINGSSSGGGTNDRIPVAAADQLPSSLMLVRPKNLRIGVERPFEYKKVRAYFGIGSDSYDLGITDPVIKDKYIVKKEGVYPYEEAVVMCVSLGEPLNNYRYKLVASIIPL